jgi:hypothetical protein
MDRQR